MRFTTKLFPVLLCGTVLLAAGCGRGAEQEEARVIKEETRRTAAESKGYVIEEPAAEVVPEVVAEAEPVESAEEAAELRREPVVDIAQATPRPGASRSSQAAPDRTDPTDRTDPSDSTSTGGRADTAEETTEATGSSRPVEVEPEVEAAPEERAERERPRATAGATVPIGTLMEVELLESLASDSTRAGETFRARIVSDLRSEDGRVAVPAGSEIVGVVDEVVPLRKVGGRAKIALRFTDLVLPSGATVPVRASLVEEGRSETKKDAATIGGATAGGAILGRILSKRGDRSRGAVIGAIIGAAAGTAIASRTPGEEVVLAAGTVVNLSLDEDVEIRSRR